MLGALAVLPIVACSTSGGSDQADGPTVEMPALPAALADSGRAEPTMWVVGAEGEGASFVAPAFDADAADEEDAAWEYFETFADVYGLDAPRDTLAVVATTPTEAGTVVRFEQSLSGLPVYGGGFTVTVTEASDGDAMTVSEVTGTVLSDFELAAPVLDGDAALERAAELEADLEPDPTTLREVAFSPRLDGVAGDPVPAWEVEIVDEEGFDDQMVVLSALDGEVLAVEAISLDAESWDVYESSGKKFKAGSARQVLEIRGGNTTQMPPVSGDATTIDGHMRTVWEYYDQTHSRSGYDAASGNCSLYAHQEPVPGTAVYSRRDGGCRMVLGADGIGGPTVATTDLVAHELTHGVVMTTAGLKYKFQSGALNEHYADFFATMIDTSDWDISTPSRVVRRTSDPAHIAQFQTFNGRASGSNDMGGVHYNSVIPNHAGYLVASTIGRPKAEKIWYSTLLKLGPKTGFGPWACSTISTAREMERSGQITEADLIAVEDAMIVIGLITHAGLGGTRGPIELCFIAKRVDGLDAEECMALAEDPSSPNCEILGSGRTGDGAATDPDDPSKSSSTTEASDPSMTTTSTTDPDLDLDPDGGPLTDCFVGSWELDSQDFLDQIMAVAGADLPPGGAIVHSSGRYLVTAFPDGTTEDRREAWTWSFSSPEGTLYVVFDGIETGTWEIDHGPDPSEGRLTVQTTGGSINVRLESEYGPLPGGNQTFPAEALGADASYRCGPDTLEVTTTQEGHTIIGRFVRVEAP